MRHNEAMESEHFKDSELRCPHCHVNGVKQELLDALEAFRAAALAVWQSSRPGQVFPGVIVNSAYRCHIHNDEIGGKPDSQHLAGIAADIRVPGMSAAQLEDIAREIPAIRGIGRADHQAYLHLDTRPAPAQWAYDAQGKTIPYYPA